MKLLLIFSLMAMATIPLYSVMVGEPVLLCNQATGITVSLKNNIPIEVLDAQGKRWTIHDQGDGHKVIARLYGSVFVYPKPEERRVIIASIKGAVEQNCAEKGHPVIVGFDLPSVE